MTFTFDLGLVFRLETLSGLVNTPTIPIESSNKESMIHKDKKQGKRFNFKMLSSAHTNDEQEEEKNTNDISWDDYITTHKHI